MNTLNRFLLPLAACAAFLGAPAAHADDRFDKDKLNNLVSQIRDKLDDLKAAKRVHVPLCSTADLA